MYISKDDDYKILASLESRYNHTTTISTELDLHV
jgi:hypothetical protein